jgi:hypothetical protein
MYIPLLSKSCTRIAACVASCLAKYAQLMPPQSALSAQHCDSMIQHTQGDTLRCSVVRFDTHQSGCSYCTHACCCRRKRSSLLAWLGIGSSSASKAAAAALVNETISRADVALTLVSSGEPRHMSDALEAAAEINKPKTQVSTCVCLRIGLLKTSASTFSKSSTIDILCCDAPHCAMHCYCMGHVVASL